MHSDLDRNRDAGAAALRDSTDSTDSDGWTVPDEVYRWMVNAAHPIFFLDTAGRVLVWNIGAARITGRAEGEMLGKQLPELEANGLGELTTLSRELLQAENRGSLERHGWWSHPEGERRWVRRVLFPIRSPEGRNVGFCGLLSDETGWKLQQESLREKEQQFRALVEGLDDGFFYIIDSRHRFLYISPSVERVIGRTPEELLGTEFEKLLIWKQPETEGPATMLQIPSSPAHLSVTMAHWNGSPVVLELSEAPARGGRYELGTQGFARDVTSQRSFERKLAHDALHDSLTKLANRVLFRDRLRRSARIAERYPDRLFAVLMVDLDGFKQVNDSLGHPLGDQLLVGIARRLEGCLRPGDTVARIGGDEFAILLDDVRETSDAVRVARRIDETLEEPFRLQGESVLATASIGIAVSARGTADSQAMLQNADAAMYRAKALGGARHEVYDYVLQKSSAERLQIESDLRAAVERNELLLVYQPIVSLHTGKIWAFEALLRWNHHTQGLLAPADFLPMAEESGQMATLDLWALGEACRQLNKWQKAHPDLSLKISVNMSSMPLLNADLPERVRSILQASHVDALHLKLEVEQSDFGERAATVHETFQKLRSLGVRLQIDNFGLGSCSLSSLQALSTETLKIDRSFLALDPGWEDIIEAMVNLAHTLGIGVVAEGVETLEQLEIVRRLGCDFAQGFVFSVPVPPEEAELLIEYAPLH